jgi:inosine-uridine nucleoside N-ribohydrolase
MNRIITFSISCIVFFCCCGRQGKSPETAFSKEVTKEPVRVIFDTDLGNDIDDVLALQMLLNYHRKGVVDLLGISISKANPLTIEYIDGFCNYNAVPGMNLGYVYDGPTPEAGNYLRETLDAEYAGQRVLDPEQTIRDSIPVAWRMIRKILSGQPDSSVVLIVVGPETNIRRLIESEADEYSTLNGTELIRQKVRLISVMGGHYGKQPFPEWNIVTDIEASQVLFSRCPVPVIASGFEIGSALPYPNKSIEEDFPDRNKNPLCISYSKWGVMPYDRPTWDLTSVLVAAEPEKEYFRFSPMGKITIDEKGNSTFSPDEGGMHRFLILDDTKKEIIMTSLVKAVTDR